MTFVPELKKIYYSPPRKKEAMKTSLSSFKEEEEKESTEGIFLSRVKKL